MANVAFVVTCMGRLAHLQQTLPRLVEYEDCECVVVDYSCPERSGEWVEQNYPRVTVARVPGQKGFSKSIAINRGVEEASAPWICLTDADYFLDPAYFRKLQGRL